jgi:hypothetical protein
MSGVSFDVQPNRPTLLARDPLQSVVDTILTEIEEIKETVDLAPETGPKWKNNSSPEVGDYGFRPLTEEEKDEFLNSLDAEGQQILAELEGKRTSSIASAEEAAPLCGP